MEKGEFEAGARPPVVRQFVPCDEARRWQGGGAYCLTRVRHEIATLPGAPLPRRYPRLDVYTQMSGSGRHTFQVQQICLRDQTSIFRWPRVVIDLGSDPTRVFETVFPLGEVYLWLPGQYEFALYSGYRQLAVAVIDVREVP